MNFEQCNAHVTAIRPLHITGSRINYVIRRLHCIVQLLLAHTIVLDEILSDMLTTRSHALHNSCVWQYLTACDCL